VGGSFELDTMLQGGGGLTSIPRLTGACDRLFGTVFLLSIFPTIR
jgi:hypothetical protein